MQYTVKTKFQTKFPNRGFRVFSFGASCRCFHFLGLASQKKTSHEHAITTTNNKQSHYLFLGAARDIRTQLFEKINGRKLQDHRSRAQLQIMMFSKAVFYICVQQHIKFTEKPKNQHGYNPLLYASVAYGWGSCAQPMDFLMSARGILYDGRTVQKCLTFCSTEKRKCKTTKQSSVHQHKIGKQQPKQ
jgi:hypothetical protein